MMVDAATGTGAVDLVVHLTADRCAMLAMTQFAEPRETNDPSRPPKVRPVDGPAKL